MAAHTSQLRPGIGRSILVLLALFATPLASAEEYGVTSGVPLRNQNPFLQIFGLPPFQSATLAADDSFAYSVSFDIVNHAESGASGPEDIVIDGESHFLTVSLRRGLKERFEFGVDMPLVKHSGGFLDSAIEDWHDLLGLSNGKRQGADNQIALRYSNAGQALYELNSGTVGIGDIQFTAALSLREADAENHLSVSVRSSVKLPTGSPDELSGSDAADLSLGIYASNQYTGWKRALDVSGFIGVLLLGEGDVLPDLQRSAVPYGGIAATWWLGDRFGISTQLQLEGPYFDSNVDELGGASAQLAVGFDYRPRRRGTSLHFSITEDIVAGTTTTPDFGVHFSIRSDLRR